MAHQKNIIVKGKELSKDSKVLILLHGRGGSAEDILSLASYLNVADFTLMAPEATNNSWYPYSFLAPPSQNEPWLSSALNLIKELVDELVAKGVSHNNIYFAGFSQGACLTLEFVTRNANHYGGVAAFTGGLIGDVVYTENYTGDFQNTPVFIGTSDPDPHVPVARVHETANILKKMNASVTINIYKNMGHTISQDEIAQANKIVFNQTAKA
jgi:phospholipase/carboxylesterase